MNAPRHIQTPSLSPVIETERLILRVPTLEDFDAFAAFAADPETMTFLGGPQPRSTAWRSFTGLVGSWTLMGYGMFSVIEKSSGRWVGRLGPWMPEGWPGTEVGYGLAREFVGKGYALEGVVASMDWAFAALGWEEIIHTIDPQNIASQAVARRVGATNRGPGKLPPPFENSTIEIWGQTREEWEERKAKLGKS